MRVFSKNPPNSISTGQKTPTPQCESKICMYICNCSIFTEFNTIHLLYYTQDRLSSLAWHNIRIKNQTYTRILTNNAQRTCYLKKKNYFLLIEFNNDFMLSIFDSTLLILISSCCCWYCCFVNFCCL